MGLLCDPNYLRVWLLDDFHRGTLRAKVQRTTSISEQSRRTN